MRPLLLILCFVFACSPAGAVKPVSENAGNTHATGLTPARAVYSRTLPAKKTFVRNIKHRVLYWLVKKCRFYKKGEGRKKAEMGLASLLAAVGGVLLLGLGLGAGLPVIGLFAGAVVLGVLSLKMERTNAKAIIGLAIGSLGILAFIAVVIFAIATFSGGIQ
jgi:hypothetical protein